MPGGYFESKRLQDAKRSMAHFLICIMMQLFRLACLLLLWTQVGGSRNQLQEISTCSSSVRASTCPLAIDIPWQPPQDSIFVRWVNFLADLSWTALKHGRSLSPEWYRLSLVNFVIAHCTESLGGDLSRCVNSSSGFALKDSNGECIRAFDTDNCYDRGQCERIANCRWPPLRNSTRSPYFTTYESSVAVEWVGEQYPKSLFPVTILGYVLSGSVVFAALVFIIMRFGYNRCWGTTPKPRGYTILARGLPVSAVILSSFVLVLATIVVGLLAPTFASGINNTMSTVEEAIKSFVQIQQELVAPLTAVKEMTKQSNQMEKTPSSANITLSYTDLVFSTSTFATNFAHNESFPLYACGLSNPNRLVSNLPCIQCPIEVCSDTFGFMDRLLAPLSVAVKTLEGLSTNLTRRFNEIDPMQIQIASEFLDELKATASIDLSTVFEDMLRVKKAAIVCICILFPVGYTSTIFAWLGIYNGWNMPQSRSIRGLHYSWLLAVLFAALGFIISGLLLAASAVGLDACRYLQVVLATPELYIPPQMGTFVRGCLQKTEIPLQLGHMENLTTAGCLIDSALRASKSNIFTMINTSAAAVGIFMAQLNNNQQLSWSNDVLQQFLLSQASIATSQQWNSTTIQQPWMQLKTQYREICEAQSTTADMTPLCILSKYCGGTTTKCYESYETAYSYITTNKQLTNLTLSIAKAFNTSIQGNISSFQSILTSETNALVDYYRNSTFGQFARQASQIQCSQKLNCKVIIDNTAKLEHYFCKDAMRFTTLSSISIFIASGFSLSLALAAILLQKRLRGPIKSMRWKLSSPKRYPEQRPIGVRSTVRRATISTVSLMATDSHRTLQRSASACMESIHP